MATVMKEFIDRFAQMEKLANETLAAEPGALVGVKDLPGSEHDATVPASAKEPDKEVTQGQPAGATTAEGAVNGGDAKPLNEGKLEVDQPLENPEKKPLITDDALTAKEASSHLDKLVGELLSDIKGAQKQAAAKPTEPAKTYNVSFDLNGDSAQFTSGGGSMEVEENGRYGSLPTAKRTGHTFAGWYTAADGGSRVNGGDRFTVNADQTLYAHWDYDPYADWDNKFKEDTNNITDPLPCYIDESDDDEVDMVKSCKGRIAESDEDPEIIIKFIKNFDEKDDEEKQAKAEELIEVYRTDHPDAAVRVILMSSKALTGGEKRKLAYRLALLDAMYGFYGEDGVMDAASELEVELEYPYLY